MSGRERAPSVHVDVGDQVVRVSNPQRVYFPALGLTKLDVVHYYLAVGEGIVRALYERPCMLRRFPEGVDGEAVYQKRIPHGAPPWVQTATVRFPSGRHADELCVTELGAVVWAVQMSTVEFHPWHSRRADTEHPDELRIDLDPQPGTGLAEAKKVAEVVRELLGELGWIGWPKTSGGRGLHIFVRIRAEWGFTDVRRAALAFAREVERRAPDLATTAWWKEERGACVFVDYNQNARDRTMASAYSVRARPHAPVSTPIRWHEMADVHSEDLTVATVPARFAALGDVQAGIDDLAVGIEPLLEWAERDERDRGLGDAPYPPHHPKMAGRTVPGRAEPRPHRPRRLTLARQAAFADRDDAGRALGERLRGLGTVDGPRPALVLALPRGGVPVGVQVARVLAADLDVVVARKVGLPWQPELGVGAVTGDGPPVFDHVLLRHVGLTEADLAPAVEAERAEVRRRVARYRGDRPPTPIAGRRVVVVDDGLATGVSARAALRAVREEDPAGLVLAVPVAAGDRAAWLESTGAADEVVAVRRTDNLVAVGRWYTDFDQLGDDRVVALLRRAWAGDRAP